jgi:hypothetical protein
VDSGKSFSVTISGIETLDTQYTLNLAASGSTITKDVGDGITLDTLAKSMTIAFTGSEITKKRYTGTLSSEDEDAAVFLRINVVLEIA